ncbi:MAG: helix-turn-helix transcriptional regulator, partial [Oscillospiraceae bacterium]
NISLSQLASQIHKSKSTVSKYETGEISIDINTLFEIAYKLEIAPYQLIQGAYSESQNLSPQVKSVKKQYVYIFDGRIKKILRSVLEVTQFKGDIQSTVTLFYNMPSFEKIDKYKSLYFGTMDNHDFVCNYALSNQTNTSENIFICVLNSLDVENYKVGLLSGISSNSFLPASAKVILSDNILKEDEELIKILTLNKEDFNLMKKQNMFVIAR